MDGTIPSIIVALVGRENRQVYVQIVTEIPRCSICQDHLIPLILCLFTETTQPTVATTHAPEPGIYLQVQANSNKHF